ncbi:MAG TPA: hypothetical protein PLC42_03715 [Parachlamydiaceae bacterium]|nr:hypothetical protein [Parachlamydiaceae bacterium]
MNNEKLLELNSLGLIPGPSESEANFFERAAYCLQIKSRFEEALPAGQFSEEALKKVKKLFDISPGWTPFFFSSYQLMPWHGGAAWIFQENEDLPTSAFFQLKPAFKTNSSYLKVYSRDELIAHEMAHVGRMMFDEPQFEELLAYRTSSSFFRRFFGPIVQSSKESLLFVASLFLAFVADFFFLAFDETLYFEAAFKAFPFILLALALFRLLKKQYIFSKAFNSLKNMVQNEEKAEAILYRLQDKEIELFSRLSESEIKAYIKKNQENDLRFRLIYLKYCL